MQTHSDWDFTLQDGFQPKNATKAENDRSSRKWMARLQERARAMVASGASGITGGKPGEPELAYWESPNGMHVTERPVDEQGILRISVGGELQAADIRYCVFRGDRVKCAHLLELAAHAIRGMPPRPES